MDKPKYKPRFYVANVTIEQQNPPANIPVGAIAEASVTIQNVPFLFTRVAAATVFGGNIDWTTTTAAPSVFENEIPMYFSFSMRTDSHVYLSDQAIIGPAIGSFWDLLNLPSPVLLKPKATVTFNVTNLIQRTATTVLQFVLSGVEPEEAYGDRV